MIRYATPTRCVASAKRQATCKEANSRSSVAVLLLSTAAIVLVITSTLQAGDTGIAIDLSGSMKGEKAAAAKQGAKLLTFVLASGERLAAAGFGTQVTYKSFVLTSDQTREDAMQFVDRLTIGGGTDYTAALSAAWPNDMCFLVFLSDGEHQAGPTSDVIQRVREEFVGRIQIHTVGVEVDAGSAAERLLQEMAVLTGGSYVRVERSEELVQALVAIAVRMGDYRTHQPKNHELQLDAAPGRLLAFAYDGELKLSTTPLASSRHHLATLPGEDVEARALILTQPSSIRVMLRSPRAPSARLGEVHVDYLPRGHLRLGTRDGRAPAGGTVRADVALSTPTGDTIDAAQHPEITGRARLIDAEGKQHANVTLQADSNGYLSADVPLPTTAGPVTIEAQTTVKDSLGNEFRDSDSTSILVEEPHPLTVTPAKLTAISKPGTCRIPLKAAVNGQEVAPELLAVRIDAKVAGIEFLGTEIIQGALLLLFDASTPGKYEGSLTVQANATVLTKPTRIPFLITVTPRIDGLTCPKERTVDFGTRLPGGEPPVIELEIPTDDEDAASYTVAVSDLTSGQATIPLRTDSTSIIPLKGKPARIRLSADLSDATPGEYAGSVTFRTKELPIQVWTTLAKLHVTDALAADPIDLGAIEVASVVSANVTVRNRSSQKLTGFALTVPDRFAVSDGTTSDVVVKSDSKTWDITANSTREIEIRIYVSAEASVRGTLTGVITVRRGNETSLRVPIRMSIVDRGAGPTRFAALPKSVALKGDPGDILTFTVTLQPSERFSGPLECRASFGETTNTASQTIEAATAIEWPDGKVLRAARPISLKGFLIAPGTRGAYATGIEIRADGGGILMIPVTLIVR